MPGRAHIFPGAAICRLQPLNDPVAKSMWIPLSRSAFFLISHTKLLILSLLLFLITLAVTALFYEMSIHYFDQFAGSHFIQGPETATIWEWIKHQGWLILTWISLIISRIIAFYVAFLAAYSLTMPGYCLLSASAEKIHSGSGESGEAFSVHGLLVDILEGCKIGLFGLAVTAFALALNVIPGAGQILVFLIYSFYSSLMFIDYPASRRHWSLGSKLFWLGRHPLTALRLGVLPAIISMIPVVNIFLMALLFPLFTVHSTLNFLALAPAPDRKPAPNL